MCCRVASTLTAGGGRREWDCGDKQTHAAESSVSPTPGQRRWRTFSGADLQPGPRLQVKTSPDFIPALPPLPPSPGLGLCDTVTSRRRHQRNMTELRKRGGGGGEADSTDNISDKVTEPQHARVRARQRPRDVLDRSPSRPTSPASRVARSVAQRRELAEEVKLAGLPG